MNASIASGAKAVVIAGTGAGSLTDAGGGNVAAVVAQGIPVVRATKCVPLHSSSTTLHRSLSTFLPLRRINNGAVVPGDYADVIASGFLVPVKARRLLQILLGLGKSVAEIQAEFEDKLNAYLKY